MLWLWIRALVYMAVVGAGWLVFLPACILSWEDPDTWPALRAWPELAAGLWLFALGAFLAVWAGYHLIVHGGGTPLPFDPPRRLVTGGPYRLVRNPQRIAMLLLVSGEMLMVESAWLWVLLPLTLAYLEAVVGPWEARHLLRQFGPNYKRYAEQVRKWVPGP
jgi:protein-S-isoprenylcysteine O-methyltransferase Ste14